MTETRVSIPHKIKILTSYHTYNVQIGLGVFGMLVVGSELGLTVVGDTEVGD